MQLLGVDGHTYYVSHAEAEQALKTGPAYGDRGRVFKINKTDYHLTEIVKGALKTLTEDKPGTDTRQLSTVMQLAIEQNDAGYRSEDKKFPEISLVGWVKHFFSSIWRSHLTNQYIAKLEELIAHTESVEQKNQYREQLASLYLAKGDKGKALPLLGHLAFFADTEPLKDEASIHLLTYFPDHVHYYGTNLDNTGHSERIGRNILCETLMFNANVPKSIKKEGLISGLIRNGHLTKRKANFDFSCQIQLPKESYQEVMCSIADQTSKDFESEEHSSQGLDYLQENVKYYLDKLVEEHFISSEDKAELWGIFKEQFNKHPVLKIED